MDHQSELKKKNFWGLVRETQVGEISSDLDSDSESGSGTVTGGTASLHLTRKCFTLRELQLNAIFSIEIWLFLKIFCS